MKQFVPLPDDFPIEALYQAGLLVPYRVDLPCHHGMRLSAESSATPRTVRGPEPDDALALPSVAASADSRWRRSA